MCLVYRRKLGFHFQAILDIEVWVRRHLAIPRLLVHSGAG